MPGISQQCQRMRHDAVKRLANHVSEVEHDADRERLPEICRGVLVSMPVMVMPLMVIMVIMIIVIIVAVLVADGGVLMCGHRLFSSWDGAR
ncbi:hypothetical protein AA700_0091 [Acidiphilium acidophilum DSM 700]|nr:hypothetical protein AA700_0091 [Acidiphilium acidophilum DSM 700]